MLIMETVDLHGVFLISVLVFVIKIDMDYLELVGFDLLALESMLHILQFSNRSDDCFCW